MNSFKTVFLKELKDIFRDRKTIIFTILLPILVYPFMFKIMSMTIDNTVDDIKKGVNIVLQGNEDSIIAEVLKDNELVKLVDSQDTKKDLKNGDIQAVVIIPEDFDANLKSGVKSKIEILVDDASTKSNSAASIVEEACESYSKQIVEQRISKEGLEPEILTPYEVEIKSGVNDNEDVNSIAQSLMGMLPSLVVMMLLVPTIGLAAEMGAGEKEKNTFEPLLSTSANRTSLLWGKVCSLAVIGMVAMILNMISLYFSLKMYADSLGGEVDFNMNIPLGVLGILILSSAILVITIVTVQITVSIYARSTKEANTYLTGVQVPTMLLCFLPMFTDANNLNPMYFNLPITNVTSLMKELLTGIYNTNHILMVLGWLICYIVLAVLLAKYMFSREEVVFRS